MALKYYFDLMSQPSRAVYMFLKMNNIPFEPKPIALRSGENFTEEFKKVNPLSRVPVIDDNGFILTESIAIMKYLSFKCEVPDHWYPRKSLQDQARVDEFLGWYHLGARLNGSMVFQKLVIIPRAMKQPINWEQVTSFKNRFETVVDDMEKFFLKNNQPYLAGQDISVADLLGLCEFMQVYACCQESLYTSNPVVNAWVERVRARTQPYFDESHKIVFRVRDMVAKNPEIMSKSKM